jgi:hypothetical protein
MALLDSEPERLSLADKMLLSDESVEAVRPDPARKRFHNTLRDYISVSAMCPAKRLGF